jgi:hypothetical protein
MKAIIFLPLLLLGCTSLTPDRIRVLSEIAGLAAEQGGREWLAKHPDHRPAIASVIAALTALRQAGVTNQNAFVEQLSALPTSTFRSESGELYVSEGLVVWDGLLNKPVGVSGASEQPVMSATLRGLRRALLPLPPMPVPSPPKTRT